MQVQHYSTAPRRTFRAPFTEQANCGRGNNSDDVFHFYFAE